MTRKMYTVMDFDKCFNMLNKALIINLCHPNMVKDIGWFIGFLIRHSIFIVTFILVTYDMVTSKANSFTQVCGNGVVAVMYVQTISLFAVVMYYQKTLRHIIGVMKEDYKKAEQLSDEEQKIIYRYIEKGQWIIRLWFVIVTIGFGVFVLRSIVLTIYYSWNGELQLVEFYPIKYPDFIEQNEHKHLVFFLKYGITAYFAGYGSIMYASCSPLGALFMLHACGQMQLLKIRIDELYDGRTSKQVQNELNDIARRMQLIYIFIDDIKTCFRASYEVTMKGAAILVPVTFFELIASMKRRQFALEYIAFTIGAVLISSSPCYYSELLIEKGEEIRMALYMCGWEREYDRGVRSSLIIMLSRALRPTAIRTMFRTISLEALTDLFQQSYAIFNLINTVWN